MQKLTRSEWFSLLSPAVAVVGAVAAWSGYFVNSANRQDTIAQVAQTQSDAKVDSRIDTKLAPVLSSLHDKEDTVTGTKQLETARSEQSTALQAIRSELEKNSALVAGTKEDLARLSGKLDTVERDVNLLLQHQLHSSADLPSGALASQLPNIVFLYEMASRRAISIPIDVSNSIRQKLAVIRPTGPAYWSVAATTISQESAALVGANLEVQGTIRDQSIIRNEFRRRRVILDGAYFAGNVFIECVIEYHGGTTVLEGNVFKNCLFVVSLSGAPPPEGQKIIQSLLDSDLRSVKTG